MARRVDHAKRLAQLAPRYKTQRSLAKSLGISESYLSRLLSGERRVSDRLRAPINRRWRYSSDRFFYSYAIEVTDDEGNTRWMRTAGYDLRDVEGPIAVDDIESMLSEYQVAQTGRVDLIATPLKA